MGVRLTIELNDYSVRTFYADDIIARPLVYRNRHAYVI